MKARFDKRQNKVTVKQLNEKDYIFLCLNGKVVKETPEGQEEEQTFYEYDYTEIVEETGVIDLNDVKKNPEQYASYKPKQEKKPEEKIAGVIIAILGRNDRRIYSIIRKEQDMYNILLKMKTKFEQEQWLKMVDQAKTRGKLTYEEYKKLIETE